MTENNKKILIAEDEKAIAKALKLKLEHEGYAVVINDNGTGILDVIKEEKPQLILLDLVMPHVDGFEVLEQLQAAGNKVPIIVLSNLSQAEDADKAKKLGAKEFFIKSNVPISDVVSYISKIL